VKRLIRLNLSLLSAILISEAIIRYTPLIWIAFVPILFAIRNERPRYRIVYGSVWGCVTGCYIFYPVFIYGPEYLLALSIYCGLIGVAIAWSVEYLKEKNGKALQVLIFPFIWVVFEFLRSIGPISFPLSIASACYANTVLIQLASLIGSYGVSFIIIVVNVIVFEWMLSAFERSDRRRLAVVTVAISLIILISIAWGRSVLRVSETRGDNKVSVAVIQGAVPRWMYLLEKKNEFYRGVIEDLYFDMTRRANREYSPDFIVWPEGAVNQWMLSIPRLKEEMLNLTEEYKNIVIAGAPYLDEGQNTYNAAFIISESGENIERYEKIKLVPWVETYFSGKRQEVFTTPLGKIGVLICFETIYPQMSRNLARKGADIIFMLTNDAGFKKTHLARLHAREAIFRAVENGCPVVRAAQSGISLIVDRYGRVQKDTRLFDSTILYDEISTGPTKGTFYNKTGDIFVFACFLSLLIIAIRRFRDRGEL